MKLKVTLIIVLRAVTYLGHSQETIKGLNGKENNTRTLARGYCADRKEGRKYLRSISLKLFVHENYRKII